MTRKLTNDQLETIENLLSSTLSNREIALQANAGIFHQNQKKFFINKNSGGRPKALCLKEKTV